MCVEGLAGPGVEEGWGCGGRVYVQMSIKCKIVGRYVCG